MQQAIPPQVFVDTSKTQFFLDSASTWEAMLKDCAAAERSIDFEQYILNDDVVGQRFLQLFADKAAQGVRVRLLLDRIGSRSVSGTPLLNEVEAKGGHIRFYNNISWLNLFIPWRWFPRNHTKVMLIDEKISFIGSVCIQENMTGWRETHLRLDGILAGNVRKEFDLTWENVKKHKRKKPYYASAKNEAWRYVVHQPTGRPNPIYRELLREMRHAEKNIYLVTPYFVPPWPLRRAMGKAVKRGVKVQVMMTERSDVPLADMVSRSYFAKILKKRIGLFLYRKTVLHSKYAVIDDKWATIGSTNMDYLSLLHNREANIITTDEKIIAQLKEHFENDLQECIKVDAAYCKNIPVRTKILGRLGRTMRRFL